MLLTAILMRGGPRGLVDFQGGSLSNSSTADTTCSYQVHSDGDEYGHAAGTFQSINTWLRGGSSSLWEVRMVMDSGTNFTGSALNTWLAVSTDPAWSLLDTSTGGGAVTGTGTLSYGIAGTSTALGSVSVTLSAEKTL